MIQEGVESTARGVLHLWGDYSLANPLFLLAAPLGVLFFLYGRRTRGEDAGLVSCLPREGLPRSLRQRLFFLPPLLQCLALALVAIALARPVRGNVLRSSTAEGIDIALLVDRSSSMAEEIREVAAGALAFFEQVLGPKDRAAVLTFNHQPELAVRFTGDPEVLAGGVAGITAEGGTALYDSLVEALYYFSGVNGKRALVVITDGEDQGSRYSFDEALDYARRTGVAVYTIGLGLPAAGARFRMQLQRLATETGGRSFLISRASELERVYDSIEEELRSQYLLAYQSTYSGRDGGFREVEVEVKRPGVSANTIRGYFP